MDIFKQLQLEDLSPVLLTASEKEVLQEWGKVPEKDQYKTLLALNEVKNYAQKTVYRAVKDMTVKGTLLSPITACLIGWKLRQAKSVVDVRNIFKQYKLPAQENIVFSEIKPQIENSFNVLIKFFMIISNNDAYNYIQVAKVLDHVDRTKMKRYIDDIGVAHANFASLISWFNTAQVFQEGRELTGTDDPNNPVSFPPPELVLKMVDDTISLLREMKIFGNAIIANLAETKNVVAFFVVIDSIKMALTTKKDPNFMILRKKLAFYYLLRDFVEDTGIWANYQKDFVE